MIYYLKTADEQSMWEALEDAGLAYKKYDMTDEDNIQTDDGEFTPTGKFDWIFTGEALHIIGAIYTKSDEVVQNELGDDVEQLVAIEGFHANLKSSDGEIEGLPTIETPSTPHHKWLGD
jgi:hypothetical protein